MSDLFLLRLDLVRVTRQRQQSLPLDVPAYLVTRRRMVMIVIAVSSDDDFADDCEGHDDHHHACVPEHLVHCSHQLVHLLDNIDIVLASKVTSLQSFAWL